MNIDWGNEAGLTRLFRALLAEDSSPNRSAANDCQIFGQISYYSAP